MKVSCRRTRTKIEIYNKYILPDIIKEIKLKENLPEQSKPKTRRLVMKSSN